MKPYCWLLLVALPVLTGCFWISGPWTGADRIKGEYDEIKIGMRDVQVKDELGEPSEVKYVLGPDGRIQEGSKEAWWLYKYDYPTDPLLVTIKLDRFGLVTEKHFDNQQTVAELAEKKTSEQRMAYPGAPQRTFMELEKKKRRLKE